MDIQQIFEILTDFTSEVIPELENHAFKMEDSLRELGANSLDRIEILTMTLEDLSSDMALVELAEAKNIGDLARIIFEKS